MTPKQQQKYDALVEQWKEADDELQQLFERERQLSKEMDKNSTLLVKLENQVLKMQEDLLMTKKDQFFQ